MALKFLDWRRRTGFPFPILGYSFRNRAFYLAKVAGRLPKRPQ